MIGRALAGVLLLVMLPLAGSAQTLDSTGDGSAQPPANQGPMIVERIHSGVLFAPEVKATRFDREIKPLVGGSIGWVAEETFFFGGGGYWMPETGHSDRELGYGGFVMQWFVTNSDRFGVSGKVLLGGGTATTPQTVTQYIYPPVATPRPGAGPQLPPVPVPITSVVRVREDFVVAEPEVNARIAFSRNVRLALGAGYRFAGNDWWRHYGYGGGFGHNDRLSGATVTFGVQIGG